MDTTTEKTAMASHLISSSSLNCLVLRSIIVYFSPSIFIYSCFFFISRMLKTCSGLKNRLYCFPIKGRERLGRIQAHCEQRRLHCLLSSSIFMKGSTTLLPENKAKACKMYADNCVHATHRYQGSQNNRCTSP